MAGRMFLPTSELFKGALDLRRHGIIPIPGLTADTIIAAKVMIVLTSLSVLHASELLLGKGFYVWLTTGQISTAAYAPAIAWASCMCASLLKPGCSDRDENEDMPKLWGSDNCGLELSLAATLCQSLLRLLLWWASVAQNASITVALSIIICYLCQIAILTHRSMTIENVELCIDLLKFTPRRTSKYITLVETAAETGSFSVPYLRDRFTGVFKGGIGTLVATALSHILCHMSELAASGEVTSFAKYGMLLFLASAHIIVISIQSEFEREKELSKGLRQIFNDNRSLKLACTLGFIAISTCCHAAPYSLSLLSSNTHLLSSMNETFPWYVISKYLYLPVALSCETLLLHSHSGIFTIPYFSGPTVAAVKFAIESVCLVGIVALSSGSTVWLAAVVSDGISASNLYRIEPITIFSLIGILSASSLVKVNENDTSSSRGIWGTVETRNTCCVLSGALICLIHLLCSRVTIADGGVAILATLLGSILCLLCLLTHREVAITATRPLSRYADKRFKPPAFSLAVDSILSKTFFRDSKEKLGIFGFASFSSREILLLSLQIISTASLNRFESSLGSGDLPTISACLLLICCGSLGVLASLIKIRLGERELLSGGVNVAVKRIRHPLASVLIGSAFTILSKLPSCILGEAMSTGVRIVYFILLVLLMVLYFFFNKKKGQNQAHQVVHQNSRLLEFERGGYDTFGVYQTPTERGMPIVGASEVNGMHLMLPMV